jgi:pimeloyl-ACP methyl ester carboxylesterase
MSRLQEVSPFVLSVLDDVALRAVCTRAQGKEHSLTLSPDCVLHVLDFEGYGHLPPIMLLHGISSCAADYFSVILRLQQQSQRVVAVDLPGHGRSFSNLTGLSLENCMLEVRHIPLKHYLC